MKSYSVISRLDSQFYTRKADEFLNEIELINSGKVYFFGTGGDGIFNIQVRIVEVPEPVLTTKEYKNVVAASPTIILNFRLENSLLMME